jgi:hypothetical protein
MISKYEKKGRFIVQDFEDELKIKQCRHHSIISKPDIHHLIMNEKFKQSDFKVFVEEVREKKAVDFDLLWHDLAGKLSMEVENSDIIFKYFDFEKHKKKLVEGDKNIHFIDQVKHTKKDVKNENDQSILNLTINDTLGYNLNYDLNQNMNMNFHNNCNISKHDSFVNNRENVKYETL